MTLTLACGLATASHAYLLLDDFTSGDVFIQERTDHYATATLSSGLMRYSNSYIVANPNNRFFVHEVDTINQSGKYAFETGPGMDSVGILSWIGGLGIGVPPSGPGNLGYGDVTPITPALDLTGENGFWIDYIDNDQANLSVSFLLSSGGFTAFGFSDSVTLAAGSGSAFVSFGTAGSSMNLAAVDSISLRLFAPTGNDIVLTSVSVVPEPASLAVLGLGAAALLRRRRR